MRAKLEGIYGIVDAMLAPDPVALTEAILAGGVRVIQYRAKAGIDRATLRAMLARTRACGALLIANDDLDAALEADGWHAGQEDIAGRDLRAVRAQLGSRILGISCDDADLAVHAEAHGADYVGTGPFARTASKADAGEPIGVAGLRAVVSGCGLPVVAIGGIDATNLPQVAQSGVAMAAVISAIATAPDPRGAAQELVSLWARLHPG